MIIQENLVLPKTELRVIAVVGWAVVIYLALLVGVDSFIRTMFSVGSLTGAEGLPDDPFNLRYVERPWLTMMHTIPGMLFAVLGPLQFMSPIRDRFTRVHRACGKTFMAVTVFSGVSAVLIGLLFPVWGFSVNQAITLAMAVFMLFAIYRAYTYIRAYQIDLHREWMIRAFTTGLSVAWFRFMLNSVWQPLGFDFDTSWNIVLASAAPTALLVAELWIRATRPRAVSGTVPATA